MLKVGDYQHNTGMLGKLHRNKLFTSNWGFGVLGGVSGACGLRCDVDGVHAECSRTTNALIQWILAPKGAICAGCAPRWSRGVVDSAAGWEAETADESDRCWRGKLQVKSAPNRSCRDYLGHPLALIGHCHRFAHPTIARKLQNTVGCVACATSWLRF